MKKLSFLVKKRYQKAIGQSISHATEESWPHFQFEHLRTDFTNFNSLFTPHPCYSLSGLMYLSIFLLKKLQSYLTVPFLSKSYKQILLDIPQRIPRGKTIPRPWSHIFASWRVSLLMVAHNSTIYTYRVIKGEEHNKQIWDCHWILTGSCLSLSFSRWNVVWIHFEILFSCAWCFNTVTSQLIKELYIPENSLVSYAHQPE